MSKKKGKITIHSSASEYLTYVAAVDDNADSMELRYEDENMWLLLKGEPPPCNDCLPGRSICI